MNPTSFLEVTLYSSLCLEKTHLLNHAFSLGIPLKHTLPRENFANATQNTKGHKKQSKKLPASHPPTRNQELRIFTKPNYEIPKNISYRFLILSRALTEFSYVPKAVSLK